MLIQVKNNYINFSKVLNVMFATSEKNQKNYVIFEMDATDAKQQKKFVEVADEAEFNNILNNIKNELK